MRRLGLVLMPCLVSGCVAVWGGAYHVESEDASGGAIRYDHVVISERAVQVHANEICEKYNKVAVIYNEQYGVVIPGGSIDEISFSCKTPTPQPDGQPVAKAQLPQSSPAGRSSGSGYLVDNTGDILTNFHVVDGCSSIDLRQGEVESSAIVVAIDQVNDLAIVRGKIPGLEPVKFRSGKTIRAADGVVVMGYPYAGLLSSAPQTTTGSITSLSGIGDDTSIFQISAPVQPGNSGGPLFDLSGNVVGTVVSTLNPMLIAKVTGSIPQNINFAIKEEVVREFLDSNNIKYTLSNSSRTLDPADVSESGARSVAMVECAK